VSSIMHELPVDGAQVVGRVWEKAAGRRTGRVGGGNNSCISVEHVHELEQEVTSLRIAEKRREDEPERNVYVLTVLDRYVKLLTLFNCVVPVQWHLGRQFSCGSPMCSIIENRAVILLCPCSLVMFLEVRDDRVPSMAGFQIIITCTVHVIGCFRSSGESRWYHRLCGAYLVTETCSVFDIFICL
jgi:hypothetical protein